jgi:hypothetical protein
MKERLNFSSGKQNQISFENKRLESLGIRRSEIHPGNGTTQMVWILLKKYDGGKQTMKKFFLFGVILFLLGGCAGIGTGLHDNLSIPAGKIEGNRFTGIRYPFSVSVPSNWKMSTDFPDFLKEFGYEEPSSTDKEVTELYAFNPATQSSLQFDFTPANRGARFTQEGIEQLTAAGTDSLKSELEKEHGAGAFKVDVGPTERISLKGVQFAAKKYVTYTLKGVKREQGWIYAYSEPDQIFILYMILEKEGSNDRQEMKRILDSFEVVPKK